MKKILMSLKMIDKFKNSQENINEFKIIDKFKNSYENINEFKNDR